MIQFSRFELANGLKVLVHTDESTPMVAVNLLYNVGSRDESPDKTGFAHLFEHLMFGGSAHVADYDDPVQLAGGDNNAFTNNDITNYYIVLPAPNLETAFWLESDRMLSLNFDERVLDVQRKVVVEEFKETCLNQPYGDAWHHLSDMAYKVHPYRWPTIGKVPQHVEQATLQDVKDFFYTYYRPNNAILVVAGPVTTEEVQRLSQKWFGDIPPGEVPPRNFPQEPPQKRLEKRINQAGNIPTDALYLAFHVPGRLHPDYYAADLLSDVLCNGPSSRLYRRLLKQERLFSSIDCYLTGSIDPGLLIIEGRPSEGVSLETAEAAIWREIELLKEEGLTERELQKIKNKVEANLMFSELNVLNKAMNLAYYELLGDAALINEEIGCYQRVQVSDLQRLAKELLHADNCCELYYRATAEQEAVSS